MARNTKPIAQLEISYIIHLGICPLPIPVCRPCEGKAAPAFIHLIDLLIIEYLFCNSNMQTRQKICAQQVPIGPAAALRAPSPQTCQVRATQLRRLPLPAPNATPLQARRTTCAAAVAEAPNEEHFDPQVCVVLGTQWGDEGKGKLVDILAQQYDVVARAQGGANAGHTIYDTEGNKYKLHLIPSGILNPKATCVIGNGVVVHLPGLFEEIRGLEARGISVAGRLFISDRAHLLFELHKEIDGAREAELAGTGKQIGTTKRGIGPAYASKATRNGLRVGDLVDLNAFAEKLRKLSMDGSKRFDDFEYDVEGDVAMYKEIAPTVAPFVTDTVHMINEL